MSKPKRIERIIPLDRIFLNPENPRHEPYETQAQIIEWLCSHEEVPQLAHDIAQHGLSPLDKVAVTLDHDTESDDSTYTVVEGNRRICALKLLTDPDLASPKRKAYFEKQAENWAPITELPCVIFKDQDDLNLWLKRRHHGPAGGIGQKPWNSDQKARHSGADSRYRLALAFLDYAEQEKLISADERRRRLTTVSRFLSNPVMRETLGLDVSDLDNISRTLSKKDFKLLSKQFISDMLDNDKVNSRKNSKEIVIYARELSATEGQSYEPVKTEPIAPDPKKIKPNPRQKPGKQKKQNRLPYSPKIAYALERLGNSKLESIYYSICNVTLQKNVPLLAVGTWSFFETLTAQVGRKHKTDFHSFLSPQLLTDKYDLGKGPQIRPLHAAVKRILDYGNDTKHHATAAAFNGDQLANDIDSLAELILKLIDDAISHKI